MNAKQSVTTGRELQVCHESKTLHLLSTLTWTPINQNNQMKEVQLHIYHIQTQLVLVMVNHKHAIPA